MNESKGYEEFAERSAADINDRAEANETPAILGLATEDDAEVSPEIAAMKKRWARQKEEESEHLAEAGADAGRRWAKSSASVKELRRLSKLVEDSGGYHGDAAAVLRKHASTGELSEVLAAIEEASADEVAGDEEFDEFGAGFIEAALAVWEEHGADAA